LAVFIRDHGGGWASKKAFDKACLDGVEGLGGNRFRDLLKTLMGRVDKTPTGQYF
jgi:hypothetical protein